MEKWNLQVGLFWGKEFFEIHMYKEPSKKLIKILGEKKLCKDFQIFLHQNKVIFKFYFL